MKKKQKEAILISYYNSKGRYEKLADHITHLIRDDPSLPNESLHAIVYRIKGENRLIEKITALNKEMKADLSLISKKNYQDRICDLLGVRIICLRLTDIENIGSYLQFLADEEILSFIKGPEKKRSFILPVNFGDSIPEDIALQYSGYSSIHYQIKLGKNSDAPKELKSLVFELQLRTILEEAWGEIDHKYRYVRSRVGETLPEHIHMGFYNLSAYLQVAALQAEHLCSIAESFDPGKSARSKGTSQIDNGETPFSIRKGKTEAFQPNELSGIDESLKRCFGFHVTPRTLSYIEKRLAEVDREEKQDTAIQKLLPPNRLLEFKSIFKEILGSEPFINEKERNIDAINALNFGIFYEVQGKRVAEEGLRAILRWRKDKSTF